MYISNVSYNMQIYEIQMDKIRNIQVYKEYFLLILFKVAIYLLQRWRRFFYQSVV